MTPLTFTTTEAAALLGVGRTTMWRLIQAGEVPGVTKFRDAVRIDRQAFLDWYRERVAVRQKANRSPTL